MLQEGDSWVLLRPDPAALAQVLGQQVHWGLSACSQVPAWHFRPKEQPPRAPTTMLCLSFEKVHHAVSTLGVLAGVSSLVVAAEGEENSCQAWPLLDGGSSG